MDLMEQVANQLQNVQNQLSAAQVEVGRLRYECVGKDTQVVRLLGELSGKSAENDNLRDMLSRKDAEIERLRGTLPQDAEITGMQEDLAEEDAGNARSRIPPPRLIRLLQPGDEDYFDMDDVKPVHQRLADRDTALKDRRTYLNKKRSRKQMPEPSPYTWNVKLAKDPPAVPLWQAFELERERGCGIDKAKRISSPGSRHDRTTIDTAVVETQRAESDAERLKPISSPSDLVPRASVDSGEN